jgi:3-oxoadipate CoA-transferase beta subunit
MSSHIYAATQKPARGFPATDMTAVSTTLGWRFVNERMPKEWTASLGECNELAATVARDIPDGSFVNLGIGQPTQVANHLFPGSGIVLHTENGMLGMGPIATGADIDPDLINAGKIPVTELPGASYFDHTDSFAMMRGGHLDVCVLGAFQVSADVDLANWHTGAPDAIPAVGGAMDLAIGAKDVFVMMNLFAKDGSGKLVPTCTYPLTGLACVSRVYTEHATFFIGDDGVTVLETFGTTVDELATRLDVPLQRLQP